MDRKFRPIGYMACDYLSKLSLQLTHVSKEALGMLPRSDLIVFCVPLQVTWKPNPKWQQLPTLIILGRSDIAICVLYRLESIYM